MLLAWLGATASLLGLSNFLLATCLSIAVSAAEVLAAAAGMAATGVSDGAVDIADGLSALFLVDVSLARPECAAGVPLSPAQLLGCVWPQ